MKENELLKSSKGMFNNEGFQQCLDRLIRENPTQAKASKPTLAESKQRNYESFNQLIIELRDEYPTIKDMYFCDHWGCWAVEYKDGNRDEFDSFKEMLDCLVAIQGMIT